MKIPEGWPTREMTEEAWAVMYSTEKNKDLDHWNKLTLGLKAALAAAPTPPVVTHRPDGTPRDPEAIESDPQGLLMRMPGEPLYATPPEQEVKLPLEVLNALRFYANGEHFN